MAIFFSQSITKSDIRPSPLALGLPLLNSTPRFYPIFTAILFITLILEILARLHFRSGYMSSFYHFASFDPRLFIDLWMLLGVRNASSICFMLSENIHITCTSYLFSIVFAPRKGRRISLISEVIYPLLL